MAEAVTLGAVEGLSVTLTRAVGAATLRYLSATGEFAARLARAGHALPPPGAARQVGALLLASVRPSEALCIAVVPAALPALLELGEADDGCLIELTGALDLLWLEGTRGAELLARLGGQGITPALGEARRSRMADVPVLALAPARAACWLLVERTYTEHLSGWIVATLADLPPPSDGARA